MEEQKNLRNANTNKIPSVEIIDIINHLSDNKYIKTSYGADDTASSPVAEPVAEPVSEPVSEPVVEPIAEPVAEKFSLHRDILFMHFHLLQRQCRKTVRLVAKNFCKLSRNCQA